MAGVVVDANPSDPKRMRVPERGAGAIGAAYISKPSSTTSCRRLVCGGRGASLPSLPPPLACASQPIIARHGTRRGIGSTTPLSTWSCCRRPGCLQIGCNRLGVGPGSTGGPLLFSRPCLARTAAYRAGQPFGPFLPPHIDGARGDRGRPTPFWPPSRPISTRGRRWGQANQ